MTIIWRTKGGKQKKLRSRHRNAGENCWTDSICSHYATAMACIVLQIPNNYLPILQKLM